MNEIVPFYSECTFHEINSLYLIRTKRISFLKLQKPKSLNNITITIYFLFGGLKILKQILVCRKLEFKILEEKKS